jgi:NAD(P)-dependent dehydrogenase (short-subunit alcohol dehydrogenase family)
VSADGFVCASESILTARAYVYSNAEWTQQFSTNVFGAFNLTRSFLPYFREKKAGTIVFIGSIGAWDAPALVGIYAASKAAMRREFAALHSRRVALSILSTTPHQLYMIAVSVGALRSELAPTGVKVTLVEPGYFRTSFLAPSNSAYLESSIPDYSDLINQSYAMFKATDGKQPGDPIKGVERIVDVVKSEGLAKGKELPPTLALGSDAVAFIRQKCHEQLKLLEEWEQVSSSTDL